jgi:hypothetical protein
VLNAAGAAVVGYMVVVDDGVSLHNRPVDIGGVDDGLIHVHHCGVVSKGVAAPLAAREANPPVAEAVIDAAVVTHVTAPVALMEAVLAA